MTKKDAQQKGKKKTYLKKFFFQIVKTVREMF